MDILSVSITLFLIMDPIGNIPVFLSVLDKVPQERRRFIVVRELLLALCIIVCSLLFGKYLLSFLGLRQESISIAGGIILFLIALRMVFPANEDESQKNIDSEPFLVPLAIPLIAGPSTLAVLLFFSGEKNHTLFSLLTAASIAWAATFVVLYFSTYLFKVMKRRGLIAMERLMGMILVALAVQLFLDGISAYLTK